MIDKCPCCNRNMYKLNSGQWTHLFSEAFKEAGLYACSKCKKVLVRVQDMPCKECQRKNK